MEHNFDRTPLFLWCLCWSPVLTCVDFGCISPWKPWRWSQPTAASEATRWKKSRKMLQFKHKSRSNILKSLYMKPKTVIMQINISLTFKLNWLTVGFVLLLNDWGGGASVNLYLRYKCLIRSAWWYGFNRTSKLIHIQYTLYMFLFKEIAREYMRDIMSYITNSNIIDVKLCGTWLLAWRRRIWNLK